MNFSGIRRIARKERVQYFAENFEDLNRMWWHFPRKKKLKVKFNPTEDDTQFPPPKKINTLTAEK